MGRDALTPRRRPHHRGDALTAATTQLILQRPRATQKPRRARTARRTPPAAILPTRKRPGPPAQLRSVANGRRRGIVPSPPLLGQSSDTGYVEPPPPIGPDAQRRTSGRHW